MQGRSVGAMVAVLSAALVAAGPLPDPPKPTQPTVPATVDGTARMRALEPAVAAATVIRAAVERSRATGFSGITLDGTTVRLWYKGPVPGEVSAAVTRARQSVTVEVHAARYSRMELERASERMLAHVRAHRGGPAHLVAIPADGHGLIVGADRAVTAEAAGLPEVGLPVSIEQRPRATTMGRLDDYAPFWGGARIVNNDNGRGCTAGFGVRSIWDGREYMLTAGHCGRPGGGWWNGNVTRWLGTGAHEHVGHDLLLIETNAGGFVFDGGVTNAFSRRVAGWNWVYPGQWVCSSGAVTGGHCDNFVDDDSYSLCGVDFYGNYECHTNLVGSLSWTDPAGRPGDSGGPMFSLSGDNVVALGTITGGGGPMLYWAAFSTAVQDFGIEPITGP